MPILKSKTSTKKSTVKAAVKVSAPKITELATRTILKPLVTEKVAKLSEGSVYAFKVSKDANRVSVRQSIRDLYGVMPVAVNVMRVHGKIVRFGGRESRQADWKKAYVTLPKGQTIDIFAV
jgi:large subunit ribosomal protein L23